MEATRGSWADVQQHSYIKDLNNKTWRVVRATADRVRLIDRDGKNVDLLRPPGNRPVTLLQPSEGDARYTLAKALEARVLASRDAEGYYRAPLPETWDLPSAKWHMSRFHRVDTGDLSLEEVRALHDSSEPTCQHEHTEET